MKNKTLQEVADLWLADKKQYVKKSTYSAYRTLVEKQILFNFGELNIIKEIDVQNFVLKQIQEGYSQNFVKSILLVLKMIIDFANKNNFMQCTNFQVKFPTQKEINRVEVLSKAEQSKLTLFLKDNFTFKNLGIYICLFTGLRIGEICGLKWEDIDIINNLMRIRRSVQRIYSDDLKGRQTKIIIESPKTINSTREIPIVNDLMKYLKPLKKIVNNDFFVISNDKLPIEPRAYRKYFDNLLKELNITKIKFHGLRHSFATRCIESKCDYKTVSVLLGHANVGTTLNLYVHPDLEQKRRCLNQMSKYLK